MRLIFSNLILAPLCYILLSNHLVSLRVQRYVFFLTSTNLYLLFSPVTNRFCFFLHLSTYFRTLTAQGYCWLLWHRNKACWLTKSGKPQPTTLLCTPAGVRTLDTLIKSQVLYQLSYGCIFFCFAGAKVVIFFDSNKFYPYFFIGIRFFLKFLVAGAGAESYAYIA